MKTFLLLGVFIFSPPLFFLFFWGFVCLLLILGVFFPNGALYI